ncbi:Nickel responsive regulator NikR [Minicystis rosea]|nr:Nickel responsive regulator NikR [Minicystis rosea]
MRFGVAMDRTLLAAFDRRIAARGYENRSEALRDLVRADLARGEWDRGGHVAATLTVVYDARAHDPLAEIVAEHGGAVRGSMRLPLSGGRALEVMALTGAAAELTSIAGRVGGARGVLSCELTLAAGAWNAVGPEGGPQRQGSPPAPPTGGQEIA